MEADASVSLDLLVKSVLALGASRSEVRSVIAKAADTCITLTSSRAHTHVEARDVRVVRRALAGGPHSRHEPSPQPRLVDLPFGSSAALFFDRHLYQPLLACSQNDVVEVRPVALNDGERDFVRDLRTLWARERAPVGDGNDARGGSGGGAGGKAIGTATGLFTGVQLYLLRNQSRGRGVGFFEAGNFYPDFILWLVEGVGAESLGQASRWAGANRRPEASISTSSSSIPRDSAISRGQTTLNCVSPRRSRIWSGSWTSPRCRSTRSSSRARR